MRRTFKLPTAITVVVVMVALAAIPGIAATPAEGGRFWDDDGSVHEENIEAIANNGVTLGCVPEGTAFCPDLGLTRAQMASFLARALSLSPIPGDNFDDVDPGSVHKENINAIADQGITLGCNAEGTLFCPNTVLNRAQMASFLARALGLDPIANGPFTDLDGAPTHAGNINAIANEGITLGCDGTGTVYCPYNTVTRGQMGSFITRGLDYTPVAIPDRLDLTQFMTCDGVECEGDGVWPANTPFYVRHGWIFDDTEPDYDEVKSDVETGFVLIMDLEDEFPSTAITSTFQNQTARFDTIDFPAGLDGVHEFEGQWLRLGEVVQTAIITIDFGG